MLHLSPAAFPFLREITKAHIERFSSEDISGRPEKVLTAILDSGINDFREIFNTFTQQEPLYSFSDLQVKTVYKKIK